MTIFLRTFGHSMFLKRQGGNCGFWRLPTLGSGVSGMYVSESKGQACGIFFSFSLPPFNFYKLGGEEEKGVPVDLTLIGGIFGMHASGSEGWACETFSYFKLCPFNFHGLFVCVCACVLPSHLFWTSGFVDVPAGVKQEEGHAGILIHLPSAVRALVFPARRIQPFLSLVDREVEFCVLMIYRSPLAGLFFFFL